MRALSADFRARLASGVTTLAHAWRVTRADGAVFGFTDHDRDLIIAGVTFAAATGFRTGATEKGLGAGIDASRIEGALSASAITTGDLERGLWDGARVDVLRVDWTDPSLRVHLFTGRLGDVRQGPAAFLADLRGLDAVLDVPFGRVYSRFCDADVGDARCGVDLATSAFRGEGVVATVLDTRTFRAEGVGSFANGWFTQGRIAWTDGGVGDVAAHRVAGDHVTIELVTPTPAIAEGAAFVVTAGCDKRAPTCRTKFANILNFRGFPHMPGNDAVIAGPDQRTPMDGASRNAGG